MTVVRLRRLAPDLLLLAVILAVALAAVGTSSTFSSDEGAALAQADMLADGDGWLLDHPFPTVDPDGDWIVYFNADGGPERFAPYAKHPLYVLALEPLVGPLGTAGALILSVLGTVVAAASAAWLAGHVRAGAERPTLWIVGLGSPLLFDAGLVMAHSVGAALCGVAACAFVAWQLRPRAGPLLLGVAAIVAAVLVRSEAVFFGIALGVALVVWGRHAGARRGARIGVGVGVAALSVLVMVLERRWVAAVVEGAVVQPAGGLARGNVIAGRVSGALWTFVSTAGSQASFIATAALVAMLGVVVVGFAVRAEPPNRVLVVGAGAAAAVMACAAALVPVPDSISGLLATCPFLLAGLVLLRRRDLAEPVSGFLLLVAALVAAAVVATQYDVGGAAEWGGRFLAIAVPVALAVAVPVVLRRVDEVGPAIGRPLMVCLVITTAALSVLSLRVLAAFHDRAAVLVDAWSDVVDSSTGDGEPPVVVTTDPSLGRLTWAERGRARQLLVEPARTADALGRLDDVGVDQVILVLDAGEAVPSLPDGWSAIEERSVADPGSSRIVVVGTAG